MRLPQVRPRPERGAIRQCNAYIFDRYHVLYTRYGRKFINTRLYHMEMHSARFAANNEDQDLARKYMWQAARARPKLFFRHVRRRLFRLKPPFSL